MTVTSAAVNFVGILGEFCQKYFGIELVVGATCYSRVHVRLCEQVMHVILPVASSL